MDVPPRPMCDLFTQLDSLDGHTFDAYQTLRGTCFNADLYRLDVVHVQGSPGAFPASMCRLIINIAELGLDHRYLRPPARQIATADYLLRAFKGGVEMYSRANRGAQGSGSYQPISLPPQIVQRNMVGFGQSNVRIAFYISLPGSHDNRILGRQAISMFEQELPAIVRQLRQSVVRSGALARHCDVVEDMATLRRNLNRLGLVAFVGDGAVLPRQSGVSQAPLKDGAVKWRAPDDLAVEVDLPNAGRMRGLGVRPGVTVLIGGVYHGKSTLLEALAKGVYSHIPGDGRESVAAHPNTVYIPAEEGRAVKGVNISGFIGTLPGNADTHAFFTNNASGSTSQAASIVEAVQAGAKLLLIDEDTSATNFLIKDSIMRELIPEDAITPFFDQVQELYRNWDVSTLIVVGGSSEYLGVAHHVMAMRNYRPVRMTDRVRQFSLPTPCPPDRPMQIEDNRQLTADNFDPAFHAIRLGKSIGRRIKPLRLRENILEYGDEQLDLTRLTTVLDPYQVTAIGYALLMARNRHFSAAASPSRLAAAVDALIGKEGLDCLLPLDQPQLCLARPRRLDLSGAINRFRNLHLATSTSNL